MSELRHKQLGEAVDATAPDGSEVRFLLRGELGELNHFTLPPGATSGPVAHHTIEEIWYFLSGRGEMWRSDGTTEETLAVGPGRLPGHPHGSALSVPQHGTGAAPLHHRDHAAVARRGGGVRRAGQVAGGGVDVLVVANRGTTRHKARERGNVPPLFCFTSRGS